MRNILALLTCAGALLMATAAQAAQSSTDQCSVIDYMLAQARTDFPALQRSKIGGGCSAVRQEYKCAWGFPGDRYDAAKQQAARLTQCIAATHGVQPLKSKRDEAGFQLNPETSVYVLGPFMDSGDWLLTLKIVSTAK